MPSQQSKGIAKGRNQGRGGEIQRTFQFCACVFALTQLAVGFHLEPLRQPGLDSAPSVLLHVSEGLLDRASMLQAA